MNRQEAITILAGLYRIPVENGADKFASEINKAIDMAIEALQDDWIPVSERLAEFPCIVTDANGNPPFVPLGIATITDKEHGTWQIDGDKVNNPKVIIDGEEGTIANWGNRIIAWRPLPEPYKESDSE